MESSAVMEELASVAASQASPSSAGAPTACGRTRNADGILGVSERQLAAEPDAFALDDGSPAGGAVSAAGVDSATAALSAVATHAADEDEDWYQLDESSANDRLDQLERAARGEASSGSQGGTKKFGLWASASRLRKKASSIGERAKKAIVEESRQLAEDARDLADGVREGIHLTAQDIVELKEKLSRDRKAARQRGGYGIAIAPGGLHEKECSAANNASVSGGECHSRPPNAGASQSQAPPASTPMANGSGDVAVSSTTEVPLEKDTLSSVGTKGEEGSRGTPRGDENVDDEGRSGGGRLQAFRQSLAITKEVSKDMWRDLYEVNQEVMNEMRCAWRDMGGASGLAPTASSCNSGAADGAVAPAQVEGGAPAASIASIASSWRGWRSKASPLPPDRRDAGAAHPAVSSDADGAQGDVVDSIFEIGSDLDGEDDAGFNAVDGAGE
eukprot:TRINITY_DN54468_c0_g1_i1.p1 TRINITY_DN54468_c0_g1~~TRINITY_DN54468_c0_g1_i1.p1  ORF type:complete len:445 (+),score=98.99 TRINITY_DN54468_c0_g1_i1:115-1449(+)